MSMRERQPAPANFVYSRRITSGRGAWARDATGVVLLVRERARVMVTVKAQPALSQKHGEVVCVAGIRLDTEKPEWIRLFPVPFRDLDKLVKFRKYQVMEVDVVRHRSDTRPESFTPNMDSATLGDVIDTRPNGSWDRRWQFLSDLADTYTMCALNRGQRDGRLTPSLAMVRPAEVLDVDVVDTPDFTGAQRAMAQLAAEADLFGEAREPLEAPPFTVRYRWRCTEEDCSGHNQMCVDWEVGGAARRWLRDHDRESVRTMLRNKWLKELCAPGRDTYFFVGNQHQHPQSYLILGVFWPPRDPGRLERQLSLLD
jgi:hypothetical protein